MAAEEKGAEAMPEETGAEAMPEETDAARVPENARAAVLSGKKGGAAKKKGAAEETGAALDKVFAALRNGKSLYAACAAAGTDTRAFYARLETDRAARDAYRLALADYADRCTDDIRQIVAELRAGDIDNPTAKLLIETEKWLAQKACPEPVGERILDGGDDEGVAEIEVQFV